MNKFEEIFMFLNYVFKLCSLSKKFINCLASVTVKQSLFYCYNHVTM